MMGLRFLTWLSLALFLSSGSSEAQSDPPPRMIQIDELVDRALQASQELKLLDEDIGRAKMELKNVRTSYWPRLTLQGTLGVDLLSLGSFDPDNNLGSDLILDWNFFQNGLVFLRVEQAKAQVELMTLQRKRQEVKLAYQIKTLGYELLEKKAMVALQTQELQWAQEALEKARSLFKQGASRRTDLLRAETQVFEKRNYLEKLERERYLLVRKLKDQTGLWNLEEVELGSRQTQAIRLELKGVYLDAGLENRVEVREGQIQYELSKKAVSVAKLGRLPRLDLFAGNAFALDDLESRSDQFQFRTGVIARYPLYDGGQTKLQIVLAEIASRRAEFQWNQSKKKVLDEAEKAFDEVVNAQVALESGETQLEAIRKEVEEAEIEFRNGNLSRFELEEMRLSLERVKVQRLGLELGVLRAKAALAEALGFKGLAQALNGDKGEKQD